MSQRPWSAEAFTGIGECQTDHAPPRYGPGMTVIYLLLLIASAVCFGLAAFAPKKAGNRVNLVPLGLLLFVLVFVIRELQAL